MDSPFFSFNHLSCGEQVLAPSPQRWGEGIFRIVEGVMDWHAKALAILQETIKERQDKAIRDKDYVLAEVLLDIREAALKRSIDECEVQTP